MSELFKLVLYNTEWKRWSNWPNTCICHMWLTVNMDMFTFVNAMQCYHFDTYVGCSFCAQQILVTINNVWALFLPVDKFAQASWCTKSTNINEARKFPRFQYNPFHAGFDCRGHVKIFKTFQNSNFHCRIWDLHKNAFKQVQTSLIFGPVVFEIAQCIWQTNQNVNFCLLILWPAGDSQQSCM